MPMPSTRYIRRVTLYLVMFKNLGFYSVHCSDAAVLAQAVIPEVSLLQSGAHASTIHF